MISRTHGNNTYMYIHTWSPLLFQAKDVIVYDEEEETDEDVRSKNLVHFLGMKDGLTASIASQGSLSEDSPRASIISRQTTLTTINSPPPSTQRAPKLQRAHSMAATAGAVPPSSRQGSSKSPGITDGEIVEKDVQLLKF